MRENPNLDLPTGRAPNIFDRVELRVETKRKPRRSFDPWSPLLYNGDLRSRWQGSQFSNRSLPICGAPKTLAKTLMSLQKCPLLAWWLPPQPKEESFSSYAWVSYRCRSASLLDAAITYRFTPKRGKERDQEADCIPADYPSQVKKWLHCIWALRQYSGKQIANDNLAHAHAHSASPPCYNTVAFQIVLLGWRFKAGKLSTEHSTHCGSATDRLSNKSQCITLEIIVLTLLFPLQNSSIDVNPARRQTSICSSWSPSWLTTSLFHLINSNPASSWHVTKRSWSNLIILPEYHLCGAQWLNQMSQPENYHLVQPLRLKPFESGNFPKL